LRPGKSIYEKYTEEIEENLGILSEIVHDRLDLSAENPQYFCPNCQWPVDPDYSLCPECHIKLQATCHSCHKDIRTGWKICPYCQAEQKIREQNT
jgi:RNA polymerase subunit RPABC4/transcription elongation factor Spt4